MKGQTGLRPFVTTIVLISLFSFFIFAFAGNFIRSTNPDSEVLNSKYGLNSSIESLQSDLDSVSTLASTANQTLSGSSPSPIEYVYLIFNAAFDIPKSFLNFALNSIVTITNVLFPSLAGTGLGTIISVVLGLIASVFTITVIFLIIKAIRTGETER